MADVVIAYLGQLLLGSLKSNSVNDLINERMVQGNSVEFSYQAISSVNKAPVKLGS